MKYIKADHIFPEELLREIQKYAQGVAVYIPNPEGVRKQWGESSGSRNYLRSRNNQIREKFRSGASICQLSDEFYLSMDTIKKIVYKANK